jgi:hypothetical protein
MRVSRPADCRLPRAVRASRPADVRRRLRRLGTCRRISTSSRLEVRLRLRIAGRLEAAAKWRDRETPARTAGPSARVRVRKEVRKEARKREAILIWERRPDPATRVRRPLAKTAAATAAGRNFRRWPRARLLSQRERVSQRGRVGQPDAQKSVVRTALPAVRLQKAAATVQQAVDTADILVRHST